MAPTFGAIRPIPWKPNRACEAVVLRDLFLLIDLGPASRMLLLPDAHDTLTSGTASPAEISLFLHQSPLSLGWRWSLMSKAEIGLRGRWSRSRKVEATLLLRHAHFGDLVLHLPESTDWRRVAAVLRRRLGKRLVIDPRLLARRSLDAPSASLRASSRASDA
ncbi:MAG: hypothetical protein RL885_15820 [Planctomycetota bacterium]